LGDADGGFNSGVDNYSTRFLLWTVQEEKKGTNNLDSFDINISSLDQNTNIKKKNKELGNGMCFGSKEGGGRV